MKKKLKIGILIENINVNYSLYNFIKYLINNNCYSKPILILSTKNNLKSNKGKKLFFYLINNLLISIILTLERLILFKTNPDFLKVFNV